MIKRNVMSLKPRLMQFCMCGRLQAFQLECLGVSSVWFNSVAQSRLTLCDPMNYSTSGLPVHH